MLCLYLLGQNCLHLTFLPYFSSETYSRKYEKLPNIVIHACKNITEKITSLKMCGPQIRPCLFTIRPLASKQLNSLTTLHTQLTRWCRGNISPFGARGPGFNSRLRQGFLCRLKAQPPRSALIGAKTEKQRFDLTI